MLAAAKRRRHRRGDVGGMAAVEFALVVPIMIVFVIGVFDISKAMILYQQVYNAAHTIPLSASIVAVQPDKSTSLTAPQVQQTLSAIFAEIPWVRAGIETGTRSVTMSEVVFQPIANCTISATTNCTHAYVAWSVPYATLAPYDDVNATGFTVALRACGTATNPTALNQTTPTGSAAGDLTSIRTLGVANPDPILVVDVHYRYTPLFFKFITGPLDFWASGYWPARSIAPGSTAATTTSFGTQYTQFDIANQLNGSGKCPAFPTFAS